MVCRSLRILLEERAPLGPTADLIGDRDIFFPGSRCCFFSRRGPGGRCDIRGIELPVWPDNIAVNDTLVQSVALLFLHGVWYAYLRNNRSCEMTLRRLGLGGILSVVTVFVVYQWSQTLLSVTETF